MTSRDRRVVLLKYYLYMATSSLGFLAPVWVVFLEHQGLSFTQITLLDSIFFATMVLAEIPTGYLGDRVGRRNSLLLNSVVVTASILGFGLARTFEEFVVVYLLWAVGQTMRSGNDAAWLYDTLAEGAAEADFARVRGRGMTVLLLVTAVTSLAGGFLASIDLFYPFLATAAVSATSFFVLLTIPESGPAASSAPSGRAGDSFTVVEAIPVIRTKFVEPPLRSFVLYVALFSGVVWSVDIFIQPVSTRAGIDVAGLGWLYAGFMVVSAVASNYAGDVKTTIGIGRWFDAVPLVLGVCLIVVFFVPLAAIPVFFLLRALINVSMPLVEQYLNDRTPSVGRATVLSASSMFYSLAIIPLKILSGVLADAISLFASIAALGGLLVVGSLAIRWWEAPVAGSASAVDAEVDPGAPE